MRTGANTKNGYEPTLWYYNLLSFTAQCEIGKKGKSNDVSDEVEDQHTNLAENNSTGFIY